MRKAFQIDYYNQQDELVQCLTCVQAGLYYAFLAESEDIENLDEIFLRDTTFYVREELGGLLSNIDLADPNIENDVFEHHYVKGGRGPETAEKVDELLDRNKTVLIQTHVIRVPFFKDFKSLDWDEEDTSVRDPNEVRAHVFLLVGHDEKNYYYVDAPWNIRYEAYIPFEGNKTIGVISKDDIKYAFGDFLNYTYIELKGKKKVDTLGILKRTVENSIKNFYKSPEKSEYFKTYFGKDALDYLIKYTGSEDFDLKLGPGAYLLSNMLNFFSWKTAIISSRRKHLSRVMTRHAAHFDKENLDRVLNSINLSRDAWFMLHVYLGKKLSRGDFEVNENVRKYFKRAVDSEFGMIEALKELKMP